MVDKPRGPTSHDVVARLRRALGTGRIGHAGTLDPMASGVLVILAGEATKLVPYLTAQDKRYEARVALGVGTDTFDAEGLVTATAAIPGWLEEELGRIEAAGALGGEGLSGEGPATIAPRIEAALAGERARQEQVPPAHSAIKVGGERSYKLARAGAAVDLAPRPVAVRALRVAGAGAAWLDVALEVAKGYYVRSLARDLGARLGVPAHLTRLRRTASGPLAIERAVPLEAAEEVLRAALLPLEEAARLGLPGARLNEEGARRARLGQRLGLAEFAITPPPGEAAAWIGPDGRLIAIGVGDGGADEEARFSVLRGFTGPG